MFYYTNVYGLKPSIAAMLFLVVRIIDVVWDPFVGTFVDRAFPKWGKYRSWLIFGGVPLALSAEADSAWFITMSIFAVSGLSLLIYC